MRYVTRVLQPGEAVVYTTKLHWSIYWGAILLAIIAVILAGAAWYTADNQNLSLALKIAAVLTALLAASSAFRKLIRRATTELAVTNHRIIYKAGLLARHTIEMNRGKVESVRVDQTLLGRLLGYGTITVRGTGTTMEPIADVDDPLAFRSHLTVG